MGKGSSTHKNVICYDFVHGVFPTRGEECGLLKIQCRGDFAIRKVLGSPSRTKEGFSHFAWREKIFSIMCSLRISSAGGPV